VDGDGDFVARRTGPRLPPAVKRPAAKLQASLQKSRVSKNRIYKKIYRSAKKSVSVFLKGFGFLQGLECRLLGKSSPVSVRAGLNRFGMNRRAEVLEFLCF
jgi:hypothetical protein